MKYYSDISTFAFSWDQVAKGFWKRYPNPYSKHVLSEDVVSRKVVDNVLYTKRLLKKTNTMTKLVSKFARGQTSTFVLEESIVDPVKKIITTYTRNIGMQRIVTVEEKCVYKLNPETNNTTLSHKQAWISSPLYGLAGRTVCSFVHQRFKQNANKAFLGFNSVLETLFLKNIPGITAPNSKQTNSEKLAERAMKASEYAKKCRPLVPKS